MPVRSGLLLGLRGVGKTVLLNRAQERAQEAGLATVMIEATDRSVLPALLAAELHRMLPRLSRQRRVRELAARALGVLASFAAALKVKYGDLELGINAPFAPGVADSGDLGRGRVPPSRAASCPPPDGADRQQPAAAPAPISHCHALIAKQRRCQPVPHAGFSSFPNYGIMGS